MLTMVWEIFKNNDNKNSTNTAENIDKNLTDKTIEKHYLIWFYNIDNVL